MRLGSKVQNFVFASAPPFTGVVWGVAGGLYLLFAARLVAASTFVHGLPHQQTASLYWTFLGCFFLLPIALPRLGILIYLSMLPLLSSLDVLSLGPCWKPQEVALAVFFHGWLLWFAVTGRKKIPKLRTIDCLVGCFALSCAIGAVYALAHPSWSNSFSVAFSWAFWPEKTEFNGLQMGYAYMSGPFIYAALRFALADGRVKCPVALFWVLGVQVVSSVLLSSGDAVLRLLFLDQDFTRDVFRLPFGPIHNLAGPAIILAGFFLGALLAAQKQNHNVKGWLSAAACCAVLLAAASFSKAAWVGLVLLGAAGFGALFGKRVFLLCAGAGVSALILAWLVVRDHIHWLQEKLVIQTVLERLGIWVNALNILLAYPFSGVGAGNYSVLMEHYSWRGFIGSKNWAAYADPVESNLDARFPQESFNGFHAHNDILEIATGMGLPTAILFLAIIASFILLARSVGSTTARGPDNLIFASGSIFGLAGFIFVGLIDSRLASFMDSMFLWQLGAGVVAVALACQNSAVPKFPRLAYAALAAPVLLLFGAAATLAADAFPKNRSFGIWNWHLQEAEDVFLLAREAQFVIPPEERLETLEFRLPKDAGFEAAGLQVFADGIQVFEGDIDAEKPAIIDVRALRQPGQWVCVNLKADRWAGRGALGSPLGVRPYSVAMHKNRGLKPMQSAP